MSRRTQAPAAVYEPVQRLWPGATVVCLGGGSSLTQADVDACRGRVRVIAINNAYQLAPWADVLYACDHQWWKWNQGVPEFPGLKFSITAKPGAWPRVHILGNAGIDGLSLDPRMVCTGHDSGYQAINLAVHLGAVRVLLLGYDMQRGPNGELHWHPPHRQGGVPFRLFLGSYPTIARPLREAGVEVLNCSRRTALPTFRLESLETALAGQAVAA